jgi:pyridoxine 4-dehydrogenase
MRLTGEGIWGQPPDPACSRALLRRVVDLGVNLIDTSDAYGPFVSERIIADSLHPYPEDLVIATKGGLVQDGPARWHPDGRPEHLKAACEHSLRTLRVESISLYQLHMADPAVPLVETIGALTDLQAEGKVRHIGLCNVTATQLEEARGVAQIASIQNRFSVLDRRAEDLLSICEDADMVFMPWAPLDRGNIGKDIAMAAIAERLGIPAHQLSIAWLLARSPATIPIPATSSSGHLIENCEAISIHLYHDDLAALDCLSATGSRRVPSQ